MIFYTLQGPSYELEIHNDKIRLVKKPWFKAFSKKRIEKDWSIPTLSRFEITVPKLIWGKLEWESFDGAKGTFRFTTTPAMVKKIEVYLQKVIIKNHKQSIISQKQAA